MSVLTATTLLNLSIAKLGSYIILALWMWKFWPTLPYPPNRSVYTSAKYSQGHYSHQGPECSPIWMFDSLTSLQMIAQYWSLDFECDTELCNVNSQKQDKTENSDN